MAAGSPLGLAGLLLLSAALPGCTLIADNEPFRVSVENTSREPWTGSVVVVEDDGDERFRRQLTVKARSLSLTIDLPPLEGTFRFVVESGGLRWEDQQAMAEGSYSWSVQVRGPADLCYHYLLGGEARTVCPTPSQA